MKGLLTKCLHTVCHRLESTTAVKMKIVTPTNAIWCMDFFQGQMTRVQYCRLAGVIKILIAGKQVNN